MPYGGRGQIIRNKRLWTVQQPTYDDESDGDDKDVINPVEEEPCCAVCKTKTQDLAQSQPPIRCFQSKFCECRGDAGLVCEPCIIEVAEYWDVKCPSCKVGWRNLQFTYEHMTYRQFKGWFRISFRRHIRDVSFVLAMTTTFFIFILMSEWISANRPHWKNTNGVPHVLIKVSLILAFGALYYFFCLAIRWLIIEWLTRPAYMIHCKYWPGTGPLIGVKVILDFRLRSSN